VLDEVERLLDTAPSYRWLRSHGEVLAVGVEGAGS
jgi:hypothetical protein